MRVTQKLWMNSFVSTDCDHCKAKLTVRFKWNMLGAIPIWTYLLTSYTGMLADFVHQLIAATLVISCTVAFQLFVVPVEHINKEK
jgi:hypothetical protein